MVIFHSYVSLPEGKWDNGEFSSKPCLIYRMVTLLVDFFWKQIGPLEIFGTLLHVSGPGHFWEKTPSIPFENRLVDWWIWELRLPNKSWGLWCQPRIFILDLWKYMEIDQPSHLNRWFSHWFRVLHVLRNALKGWWTPAVAGWQTLQWHAQRGRRSSRSAPSDVCWLSPWIMDIPAGWCPRVMFVGL